LSFQERLNACLEKGIRIHVERFGEALPGLLKKIVFVLEAMEKELAEKAALSIMPVFFVQYTFYKGDSSQPNP
jgi:hypothetical protein